MNNTPAGLIDGNLEIFLVDNQVMAIDAGKVLNYMDLPEHKREPFQTELANDEAALSILINDFGIQTNDDAEEQFVGCRYGSLNSTPDYDGKRLKTDAPVCDHIADCTGFNIVCKVPNGLTRREYEIIRLIVNGKQDIEISFEFKIALPTVRTHLNNIREKIKVNNRVEIAAWAREKGIY